MSNYERFLLDWACGHEKINKNADACMDGKRFGNEYTKSSVFKLKKTTKTDTSGRSLPFIEAFGG